MSTNAQPSPEVQPSPEAQPSPDDSLYALLPAIYRMRDAVAPGYPLRTLLRAIAGQAGELAADTGHLYDNWFIETCDDDLVPYFAELVGLQLGPSRPTSAGAANSGADASWRRAQVADAIADRSRKGSFSVLEQLATQATGWPARAIELRARAVATQSVADARHRPAAPDRSRRRRRARAAPHPAVGRRAADRRPPAVLAPHPRDHRSVRRRRVAVAPGRRPGQPGSSGQRRAEENRYSFDQLGRDLALAVIPAGGGAGSAGRPDSTSRGRSPAAR